MGPRLSKAEAPSGPISIRPADKKDLDNITDIVKAGFPDDPGCDYKYPFRDKYPDDFWKWTRRDHEAYIDQPEKFVVLVATQPVAGDERGQDQTIVDRPIAYAVWDTAVNTKARSRDHGINERRDANPEHMKEYAQTMSMAFPKYFGRYGGEQLSLQWLITHPNFRRRGAGTMLCGWGEQEAIKRGGGWSLTVMASPMGRLLYEHLGYRLLGAVTAQVDGEEERVDIYILAKEGLGATMV
ncbi:hypothetical protein M406DRAFT_253529 [Cryphonectria parasitica EP155]|uniref:N-acetyltransferase domain-containing protein n=1 Tax=Cryphonectria parasitica (strain ATCC 38755 / EP155) TaxID=660469 RepID=A0A9P5CRC8_CRYP1|nr:uncharacterized protein M406DRAFT_253529 [Cryphonectria parasitica EP155]KAF3768123.1 hypothetical protein M406DRAFT_253529 [Cryphonectria parasitica EP155]